MIRKILYYLAVLALLVMLWVLAVFISVIPFIIGKQILM